MFTEIIKDPYFIFTTVVTAALCFFHYRDEFIKSNKKAPSILKAPLNLKKEVKADFNVIESRARVSYTVKEKEEVQSLIEIFKVQYSHYSETRYNVQILQCINKMRNKTSLTYRFEFLN